MKLQFPFGLLSRTLFLAIFLSRHLDAWGGFRTDVIAGTNLSHKSFCYDSGADFLFFLEALGAVFLFFAAPETGLKINGFSGGVPNPKFDRWRW